MNTPYMSPDLPQHLRAVVDATYRKRQHRCVSKAAQKLQREGLVEVVEISRSGETSVVEPV